jgi:hypothetical protein
LLQFSTSEVLGLRIDGLKPAAINGNDIAIQQFDVPAQGNKLLTDLTDGWTIILPEVGNYLEGIHVPTDEMTEPD